MNRFNKTAGFTVAELMVVVGIIIVLAGVIVASMQSSSAQSRDTDRLSDIRNVQGALERYKLKNGRYPAGCNDPSSPWNGTQNWSGELGMGNPFECSSGSTQYIVGLAPEFIPTLPTDPRTNSAGAGYVYTVSEDGQVYKFMALDTVETETVTVDSEFHRCGDAANDTSLLCAASPADPLTPIPYNSGSRPASCSDTALAGMGNDYAVSAGFATGGTFLNSNRTSETAREYFTDLVRCK